jgi:hypothetical protein
MRIGRLVVAAGLSVVAFTTLSHAQTLRTLSMDTRPAAATSICGAPVPPPNFLPPAGSGPVVYLLAPCFERQGGRPRVDPLTYLADIQLKPSRPSAGAWTPYDAAAERVIFQDSQRLSSSHSLADLTIEIRDYTFSNGVVGKLVIYDMIERN